jgi:hypothetical protein
MTASRRPILATALASLALAAPTAAATDPSSADTLRRVERIARESERRHGIPVGAVTTIAGLNGVHVSLCRRSPQRCKSPARTARAQARFIARLALERTAVAFVVVALPHSPTRHVQLFFERGRMTDPECVYETDSPVLVRLS